MKKRLITKPIFQVRLILYFGILLAGIYLRFSTPCITILDPDSTGYIAPALKFFASGQFDHVYARSYVYPVFLTVLLSLFSDINAICITQHIFGIVGYILFILFIEKTINNYYIKYSQKEIAFSFLVILLASSVFLNGNIIVFEKMLRPEGIIMPITIIISVLLYCYLIGRKSESNSLILFASTIFFLYISSLLFPRMSLGFIVTSIVLVYIEIKSYKPFFQINTLFVISTSILLFLICYLPESYLVYKYDKTSKIFAHKQFFYSNAKSVFKSISKGFSVEKEFDISIMKNGIDLITNREKDAKNFPFLEYDLDKLQYENAGDKLNPFLVKEVLQNYTYMLDASYMPSSEDTLLIRNAIEGRYTTYYSNWSSHLIVNYPIDVLQKSIKQCWYFFLAKKSFFELDQSYYYSQNFQRDKKELFDLIVNRFKYKPDYQVTINFPQLLYHYHVSLKITLHFLLVLSIIYNVINPLKNLLASFLTLNLLLSILTVAIIHTFDNNRYSVSLFPLILVIIYLTFINLFINANSPRS